MKTKDVIAYFGNQQKTGDALGISRAAVGMWGEDVPPVRQYQIQVITKNKLKAVQK